MAKILYLKPEKTSGPYSPIVANTDRKETPSACSRHPGYKPDREATLHAEKRVKERAQNLILEAAFLLQSFAEDNARSESRVAWLLEDCAQILMNQGHFPVLSANQLSANQSESEL